MIFLFLLLGWVSGTCKCFMPLCPVRHCIVHLLVILYCSEKMIDWLIIIIIVSFVQHTFGSQQLLARDCVYEDKNWSTAMSLQSTVDSASDLLGWEVLHIVADAQGWQVSLNKVVGLTPAVKTRTDTSCLKQHKHLSFSIVACRRAYARVPTDGVPKGSAVIFCDMKYTRTPTRTHKLILYQEKTS